MLGRDEKRVISGSQKFSSCARSFLSHYWLALLFVIFIVLDKLGFIATAGAYLLRSYPDVATRTSISVCEAEIWPTISFDKWSWLHLLPIDGLSQMPDTPTLIPFRRLGTTETHESTSGSSSSSSTSSSGSTSSTSSSGSTSSTSSSGSTNSSPTSSSHSSSGDHDGDHSHQHDALFFLVGCLLVGTAVTQLSSWPIFHGIQITVVLFVLGVCTALFLEAFVLDEKIGVYGRSYDMWVYIDPHLLLFTMLPPLVTGDAMTIDTNVAKRVFLQCLYLAGPGVAICGMTIAIFLWWYLPYDWPFLLCLTAGSILCATDPVAVVALLKELGAAPALTVQIQGESLLNDGTAIVLYTIAYNMLGGKEYGVGDIVVFLVKMAIYAWGLGMLIGYAFFCWIRATNNKLHHHSAVVQIALTVCCAYSSFIVAEGLFHISGVLSTVAAAFVLAHRMWPEVADTESMHTVWHMLEYLMNTLIFFLSGCLSGHVMLSDHIRAVDYLHLLVIYVVITLIRGALIFCSRPLLRILHTDRQEVTLADAAVMTWGGLRGAIGLALAIQVARDRADDSITQSEAHHVLFFVSGIAALTLIVNATTCPILVKHLGITQMGSTKRKMLQMIAGQLRDIVKNNTRHGRVRDGLNFILNEVDHEIAHPKSRLKMIQDAAHSQKRKLRQTMNPTGKYEMSERHSALRQHASMTSTTDPSMSHHASKLDDAKSWLGKFANAKGEDGDMQKNEDILDEFEMMKQDYKDFVRRSKNRNAIPKMPLQDQEKKIIELLKKPDSDRKIDSDILRAVNEAMLSLVLTQYWEFIAHGDFFGSEAEQVLASITIAFASHYDLVDFAYIEPFVETPFEKSHGRMSLAAKRTPGTSKSRLMKKKKDGGGSSKINLVKENSALHQFIETPVFNFALASLIIGSAIITTIEQEVRSSDSSRGEKVWLAFEIFFTSAFLVEFLLKVSDEKLQYFRSSTKLFELFLVVLGIVGCVLGFIGLGNSSSRGVRKSVTQIGVVFRMLRIARVFRLRKLWRGVSALSSKKTRVEEVCEHMMKSAILKTFIKAHMTSQHKLVEYFGHHGKVNRVEVARIILQSQSQVYKAIAMMGSFQSTENGSLVEVLQQEVRYADLTREMTDKFGHFLLVVHEHGVLTSSETDSMLEPLHHRIEKIIRDLKDYHHGRIDLEKVEDLKRASTVSEDTSLALSDDEGSDHGSLGSDVKSNDGDDDQMSRPLVKENSSSSRPSSRPSPSILKKGNSLFSETANSSGPSPKLVGRHLLGEPEPCQEPPPEAEEGAGKKKKRVRPAAKKKSSVEIAMEPLLGRDSTETDWTAASSARSAQQVGVGQEQPKAKAKKRLKEKHSTGVTFDDGV